MKFIKMTSFTKDLHEVLNNYCIFSMIKDKMLISIHEVAPTSWSVLSRYRKLVFIMINIPLFRMRLHQLHCQSRSYKYIYFFFK